MSGPKSRRTDVTGTLCRRRGIASRVGVRPFALISVVFADAFYFVARLNRWEEWTLTDSVSSSSCASGVWLSLSPETDLLSRQALRHCSNREIHASVGLGISDAEWLCERLKEAARGHECQPGKKTTYGQRYLLDFDLSHEEKTARLRSVWNVRPGEDFPRLVTCYVL